MIYSPLRSQILDALVQEPRLSARQIARLIHPQDGASFQNPSGYDKTNAMLNRMAEEKILVKLTRPPARVDFLYSLKESKRKALKYPSHDHEVACGDVYIGLKKSGALEEWTYYPHDFTTVDPDRKARLADIRQDLFLEVDRGTEPGWKLEKKILFYPPGPYQVIFVAPDDTRAEQILRILESVRRGHQFLVTLQEWMATNPLGQVYVSPVEPAEKRSLRELQ